MEWKIGDKATCHGLTCEVMSAPFRDEVEGRDYIAVRSNDGRARILCAESLVSLREFKAGARAFWCQFVMVNLRTDGSDPDTCKHSWTELPPDVAAKLAEIAKAVKL
jgi:hypothetical protein